MIRACLEYGQTRLRKCFGAAGGIICSFLGTARRATAHDLDLGPGFYGSAFYTPVAAARERVASALHATEPPLDSRVVVVLDHGD